MSERRCRASAFISAVALIFILLFSSVYIGMEYDHDCTEDNCLICLTIQLCEQNLKQLSSFPALTSYAVAISLWLLFTATGYIQQKIQKTLVNLKVRLNN